MTYSDESYNLRIELDTKNYECTAQEIARMERALRPLDAVTRTFPVSDLYVTVIRHPRSGDFHVKTSLVLSGRTLFTGDRHRQMYAAYERCIDKLVRKVGTYKSQLSDDPERAKYLKGTAHELVPTQTPDAEALRHAVDENDYFAFRRATSAYEEPLRKRIGRWIQRYPDLQRIIGDGLEINDIVEDVFLTAFEEFHERPADVLPGDWLEELIDPVVRAIVEHPDDELDNISMIQSAREAEERS